MHHSTQIHPRLKAHSLQATTVVLLLLGIGYSRSNTAPTCHAPVGLRNLGNTCYLNAPLQCAYHIPRIRSLVLEHSKTKESANTRDEEEETTQDHVSSSNNNNPSIALQALAFTFQQMNDSTGAAVTPNVLCTSLGIAPQIQQDSQEFWKLLLPALQLHPLTDLYQGAYQDYIHALDGSGRQKTQEEPFLDLSLDVTTQTSVLTALKQDFTQPYVLEGDNAWRPAPGEAKVRAHKGMKLLAQGLPNILQLHLKRFQFDWSTETTHKLNTPFAFPLVLNLADICRSEKDDNIKDSNDEQDDTVVYDLQSIVVHMGEYGSGHYYAYVRPNLQDEDVWYRFNDHIVEQVDASEVLCDSYGGRQAVRSDSNTDKRTTNALARWMQRIFGKDGESSYGYGGATSNAYVLQYVKRSAVPDLYATTE